MKKILSILFMGYIVLLCCSCGKEKTPDSKRMIADLNSRSLEYVFEINDVKILRSQLIEKDKLFFADVSFSGSNKFATYSGTTRMGYNLYDQGWMLDWLDGTDISYNVTNFQTEEEAYNSVVNSGVLPCERNAIVKFALTTEGNTEIVKVSYYHRAFQLVGCYYNATLILSFDGKQWDPYFRDCKASGDMDFSSFLGDYYSNTSTGTWRELTITEIDKDHVSFIRSDGVPFVYYNYSMKVDVDESPHEYGWVDLVSYKDYEGSPSYLAIHIDQSELADNDLNDAVSMWVKFGDSFDILDNYIKYPNHYRGDDSWSGGWFF